MIEVFNNVNLDKESSEVRSFPPVTFSVGRLQNIGVKQGKIVWI